MCLCIPEAVLSTFPHRFHRHWNRTCTELWVTRAGGQARPPRPPRPEGHLRLTFLFLGAGSPNRKWAASDGSGGEGLDGEDGSLARSQPQSPLLLLLLQLCRGRPRASFQGSGPGSVGTRQHPW